MFGGALAALAEFGESWSSYLESEAEGTQQHGEAEDEDGAEGSARGEIDQIVAFFEREYDGREDSFRPFFDTADDVARLHELRVQYFNLTTTRALLYGPACRTMTDASPLRTLLLLAPLTAADRPRNGSIESKVDKGQITGGASIKSLR